MWNIFNKNSSPIREAEQVSEAERALNTWGIKYKKTASGTLFVPGNLDISVKDLLSLPDLRQVKVGGDFYCNSNVLSSLKGAPQSIGGSFWCQNNFLTSLEHAPKSVGGNFWCSNNHWLLSLEGAPQSVGGDFHCSENPLTSLEYAPQTFNQLKSDFGVFGSWQEVPETLRLSPLTKILQREAAIQSSTVLLAPLTVKGPLRLKIN